MTDTNPLPAIPGFNDYANEALRTLKPIPTDEYLSLNADTVNILHGCLGAAGEVGELCDQLKRHLFYGKDLDIVNLKEEVGDVLWYLATIARGGRFTLQEAAEANIRKLEIRYPKGFTEGRAGSRDLVAERQALEV